MMALIVPSVKQRQDLGAGIEGDDLDFLVDPLGLGRLGDA